MKKRNEHKDVLHRETKRKVRCRKKNKLYEKEQKYISDDAMTTEKLNK